MEFSYDIFPVGRVIVTRYVGNFTLADLVRTSELLFSDARYSREFDGLVDMSDTSAGVGLADFRAFLKFIRQEPSVSRGRWAAITTTPFATACSFMYRSAMAGRHTMEIFSTWEAACEFLNVEFARDLPLTGGRSDAAPA